MKLVSNTKFHQIVLKISAILCLLGPAFPGFVLADPAPDTKSVSSDQLPSIEIQGIRNKIPLKDLPTSISVIDEEEMEIRNHLNVRDMLREEVGLDVLQNGGFGATALPNLRGLGSSNTLVLIDGIQVNSNAQGSFDISRLLFQSTERIEIVRGTQSTVWGADAVGGVINIVSKSGQGIERPTVYFGMEGGSFETVKGEIGSRGDLGLFDYSVNLTALGSASISAADGPAGNPEADTFRNRNVSTRLGLDLPKNVRVELIGHFYDTKNDSDSDGAVNATDGGDFSEVETVYLALPVTASLTDWWDLKLNPNLALNDTSFTSAFFSNKTSEQTYTVDLQNNFKIGNYFSGVLGGEHQDQNGEFPASGFPDNGYSTSAFYYQGAFNYHSQIVLTAGGRHDDNSRFGSADTYKFEAAFTVPQTGTRIRGARATGFRAPTLNQLFISFPPIPPFAGGFFGNPNLTAEKSKSWEVGIEQPFWDNKIRLSTLYFHTDIRNQISFVFDPVSGNTTAQNNQLVTSEGFETTLQLALPWDIQVAMNHTWTEANNRTAANPILGVADHKFTAQINHNWNDKLNTRIGITYRGESFSFGQAAPVAVPDYTVVRASLAYKFSDKLFLTLRGENLMDAQYQEIANFGTPGISGYAGFTYYFHN